MAPDLDASNLERRPRTGDNRCADAEFARRFEALTLDVEGMILGRLNLRAIGEEKQQIFGSVAYLLVSDFVRGVFARCGVAGSG